MSRFHERGYNVLVIDWPGQGQSGHFGWHPLAVHCEDFDHHIGAMDAVIKKPDWMIMILSYSGIQWVGIGTSLCSMAPLLWKAVILSAPMMAPPVCQYG